MSAALASEEDAATPAKPFVRWVGGKAKLVPELLKFVPTAYHTYRECFLGGGALFFTLQPPRATLSDSNAELIHAYTTVRDQHMALIVLLQQIETAHSKEHYYFVRGLDPRTLDSVARAAHLIYMNKAAFNGLYRVNRKGQFNVPWDPDRKTIADEDTIARAHDALAGLPDRQKACLLAHDFRQVEHAAIEGDFVYADSPYVPVSTTANFTSYTTEGFTHKDQVDLRDMALRLKRRGVHVLLSNSASPIVEQLYAKDFELHPVERQGTMNSKASKRGAVKEYIIR